ncbi:MAG: SOS response-associated peptidase family protein [Pseudomonadota bacterium]
MCGFVRNVIDSPEVQKLLIKVGLGDLVGRMRGGRSYLRQTLHDHVIATSTLLHLRDAVWWYAMKPEQGRYVPNWDITSFNARNLDSRLWRNAIKQRRGLVIVDTLGESQPVPNRKTPNKFLMESSEPMLIGTVFKEWDDGTLSAAVITRDPHPAFAQFHEKSMPLFLPPEKEFVSLWLNPGIESHPEIDRVLNESWLYYDLNVTRVDTYKNAKPLSESVLIPKDD